MSVQAISLGIKCLRYDHYEYRMMVKRRSNKGAAMAVRAGLGRALGERRA